MYMYNLNLECTFIQVDWQHKDHNTGWNIFFHLFEWTSVLRFVFVCLCVCNLKNEFFYWLDIIFLFRGLFEGPQSLDIR